MRIKYFSATDVPAIVGRSLPPNLQLFDEKIFEEPPKPLVSNLDHYFPTLTCPESIKVTNFLNPTAETGLSAPLNHQIFTVALRKDIIHEIVRYHRNKMRRPYKTKRISEISGSKKKPRPQKGSGQSQAGHKRNSAWRGGFKAHGPVLRDFSFELNRKYKAMGMMITLAAKLREGNLIVFDKIAVEVGRMIF